MNFSVNISLYTLSEKSLPSAGMYYKNARKSTKKYRKGICKKSTMSGKNIFKKLFYTQNAFHERNLLLKKSNPSFSSCSPASHDCQPNLSKPQ